MLSNNNATTTLEATPKSWGSRKFLIGNGQYALAELDFDFWKERGTIQVGADGFHVRRERFMSGLFLLEGHSGVVAQARKPSSLRSRFIVEYDGISYELRQRSIWSRKFILLDDNLSVGSVAPLTTWSMRADVRLPRDWPLQVQLFVVWLVLLMWRRQASGGAAAAS